MDKVEYLLSELSIEEAISIISGSDAWHSTGVERLSIPRLKLTDGPNGARGDGVSGKTSACFPCGIALGSTWDIDLLKEIGRAMNNNPVDEIFEKKKDENDNNKITKKANLEISMSSIFFPTQINKKLLNKVAEA